MMRRRFAHKSGCAATAVEFTGTSGDLIAECRACNSIGIIARAPQPAIAPPETPAEATPKFRRVCPDCRKRPARDQRDAAQDGRCRPCAIKSRKPRQNHEESVA